ncbi:iron complex outermembrane recepter protein [Flavobacterium aquidurense]|uniref:TonB-dependent siderophore receptor n=1 Tax=Flavobacterium frigidimaris TaxID=262320 RepID=A0ABX4BTG4_FLAFR|nr:TonB-dependent receptor [Flavobacterium frigidimaris]OXA80956.1 TonB-dependent siderophore receptor [Flavobacterium frigidimaris]SDY48240.1 iron complex outermembrane recepter protein [Flavobacterium aquidurense]
MNIQTIKKVFFYVLFLTSLNMVSQELGKVTGKISLSGNIPAENIAVSLKGTKYSTLTNSTGQYEIKNVKPGNYVISIHAIGIQPVEDNIVVKSKQTTTKSFALSESQEDLDEVVITKNKYKQDKPSLSLRLQTPVLEIPQNIQIVSGQTLKDQQITSMSDGVIRNVSGAVRLEHWGDLYTNITMRGSQIQAFRNGFNVVSSFWGPLTEDMSFVDHIEFVKGPAGFMLSSGDPSGLYNVVTKKPTGVTKGEVSVLGGSYDFYRVSIDLDGKLDKKGKLLYRFNGAAQNKGSHRDYEHNNRYVIAPVISYQFDDKTKITAEYNFQYANMTEVGSYYVFGPESGGYGTLPVGFTMTQPGLPDTNIQDHSGYLMFEHKFDDNWKLTAQTSYFKYIQQGYSSWPGVVGPGPVDRNFDGVPEGSLAAGEIIRNVGIWDAESNMYLGQIFVNGKFNTGSVSHKILGGVDLGSKDYAADWGQSHDLDTVDQPFNVNSPNYGPPSNGFPAFDHTTPLSIRAKNAGGLMSSEYAAGYVQDELGFFQNKLRLTLAARYTWISQASWGGAPIADNHITPRVGISYSVTESLALYGLYDQAFTPQSGIIKSGESVKPLTGNNVEFGVKKDWFDGSWSTTLAAYSILKKNELTSDPANTPGEQYSVVLGEKRAQGIEFDLRGKIFDGLNLIANYAFTESIVNKVDPAVSAATGIMVGDIVPGYSKHVANAWLNYTVQSGKIKGFGVSLGGTFLDGRQTDTWSVGLQKLPSYFKLDGGLSYETGKVKVTANVFNILDKYLYSGSYYSYLSAYYWQTEAPRNFRVGVTYKF